MSTNSQESSSKDPRNALWLLFIGLTFLITLAFLNSRGSGDVATFQGWIGKLDASGLVRGFAAIQADYPPLSHVILWSIAKAARLFRMEVFFVFKWSLVLFLFLTSFSFWLWTRDLALAAALHLALLSNSLLLGFLDIYFAPTLILALWALQQRRLTAFAIVYSLSFLTKWQPLIIAPFLIVHIMVQDSDCWSRANLKTTALKVSLPISASVGLMGVIFGAPFTNAFMSAIDHTILSGQALNLAWIMTYVLQMISPAQFGALVNGHAQYLFTTAGEIVLIPKILFYLFYAGTFFAFLKDTRNFQNMLQYALVGFLSYYMLNTGVHENHLFVPAILSILFYRFSRTHLALMLFCVAMNILNPLVFLGFSGGGFGFSRVVGIDMTVVLAAFNLVFFFAIYGTYIMPAFRIGRSKTIAQG